MTQIQSTAIRNPYLRETISRTIDDIHDTVKTVFGPYATDAYIYKDDQQYYTRDGKEVLASINYDNDIARNVRNMLYQAVHRQGTMVGDGTTTLTMLYTNLYKAIVEDMQATDTEYNISVMRPIFKEVIKLVTDHIKDSVVPVTREHIKSLVYTCTQDPDLAELFYKNLTDAVLDEAYIVINKSNVDTEFSMTVHENPIIKADKQYSLKPFVDNGVVDNVSVFYCKGMLDISDPRTLLGLAAKLLNNQSGEVIPHTVMILCHGVNETTRKTLKEFTAIMNEQAKVNPDFKLDMLTNIVIYTIRDYRKFDSEMTQDLVTYLYEVEGIGGIVNQLSFESLMYQALINPDTIGGKIEALETFDSDPADLEKLKEVFLDMHTVSVDSIEGIRFGKPMGKLSTARYNELRKAIEDEKVPVKQLELRKRLRALYGKFIEVEIGSKLMKDSQRTYELMLDAVLSAGEAVRHGALTHNSIMEAYIATDHAMYDVVSGMADGHYSPLYIKCLSFLKNALEYTIVDMMDNRFSDELIVTNKLSDMFNVADGNRWDWENMFRSFNLKRDKIEDVFNPNIKDPKIVTANGEEIDPTIIEPVTIITTLLENSVIALELATAKLMTTGSYIMNFIK
nr:MAG TPA: GroEL protein allosteric state, Asymmetrical, tetradecamer [Caudoviricetes sp.]